MSNRRNRPIDDDDGYGFQRRRDEPPKAPAAATLTENTSARSSVGRDAEPSVPPRQPSAPSVAPSEPSGALTELEPNP
jgi:hypothetical protein